VTKIINSTSLHSNNAKSKPVNSNKLDYVGKNPYDPKNYYDDKKSNKNEVKSDKPNSMEKKKTIIKPEECSCEYCDKKFNSEKEAIKHENKCKNNKNKKKQIYKIIIPLLILILIILIIIFLQLSKTSEERYFEYVEKNITKTIYYEVVQNVSIAEYINSSKDISITVLVHLLEENIETNPGSYKVNKYIVDDYGNRIRVFTGISGRFDSFFKTKGITKEIYNVSGNLRTNFNYEKELILDLTKITISEKPTEKFSKQIILPEYVEISKIKPSRINFSYGFIRITNLFKNSSLENCPTGYRKINYICIKIN